MMLFTRSSIAPCRSDDLADGFPGLELPAYGTFTVPGSEIACQVTWGICYTVILAINEYSDLISTLVPQNLTSLVI